MNGLPTASSAPSDDKKENKPWKPEEKQLFYKGFNKYYKKFQQISQMIPTRSFTQVRQLYYRETKKIQHLLGEAQTLVDWNNKDHVLCVFNSYANITKNGTDASKIMKSKKYVERLKHSIEKINRKQEMARLRKNDKAIANSLQKPIKTPSTPQVTLNTEVSPAAKVTDPVMVPTSSSLSDTMVIRLIPATDLLNNKLKAYHYCPLLELTVPRSLLVRSLINYLRTRWNRFCVNIRGVFRLCIASSSITGVWVENTVQNNTEEVLQNPNAKILHSSNSLLSTRMTNVHDSSTNGDKTYGNSVLMTMEQLLVMSGKEEPLKLSYDYCIVSHSRRVHTFLLSHELPSKKPILYNVLVGTVQSTVFQQNLYGKTASDYPIHTALVKEADIVNETKKKRKSTARKSKKVDTSIAIKTEQQPSMFTSFKDVLPYIHSDSNQSSKTGDSFVLPSEEAPKKESTKNQILSAKEQSTSIGPSFNNYIQVFNSNGWIEQEKSNFADPCMDMPFNSSLHFPVISDTQFNCSLPSFRINTPNSNSVFTNNILQPSLANDAIPKEKTSKDVNSKISNLYNRMTPLDCNSIQFGNQINPISPIPNTMSFGKKEPGLPSFDFDTNQNIFQKDNSLCFPLNMDGSI